MPYYTAAEALALAHLVSSSGKTNVGSYKISLKSGLNLPAWDHLLHDYPDWRVVEGARYGWSLNRDRSEPNSGKQWPNHKSALNFMPEIKEYMNKERKFGSVVFLGKSPPLSKPVTTIPLMTVPKPPKGRRVCADASFPPYASLNSTISKTHYEGSPFQLHLPSVWDFINDAIEIGLEMVEASKTDWARGYRQQLIQPGDWEAQLFFCSELGGFIMDTRGIFGVSIMCFIQQTNSLAVAWASQKFHLKVESAKAADWNPDNLHHVESKLRPYLDDHIQFSHRAISKSAYENLIFTHEILGIRLSETPGHNSPPAREVNAIGFHLDFNLQVFSIPPDKIHELLIMVHDFRFKVTATIKELRSLFGRMFRVSQVISDGRKFMNRCLPLIRGNVRSSDTVHLSKQMKLDLRWWAGTAEKINTRPMMNPIKTGLDVIVSVDGRGKLMTGEWPAIGGINNARKEFFHRIVPEEFKDEPIHVVEALAFVVGARLWCALSFSNIRAVQASDSEPLVNVVNHGRGRDEKLQAAARIIWHLNAVNSSGLLIEYVNTKDNEADPISRGCVETMNRYVAKGYSRLKVTEAVCNLSEVEY